LSDKRRDARYPARIMVRLVRRNETIELLTNDVSFRGAFIRTDAAMSLRQLVRVSFALPAGETVQAHAMVVHAVRGDPKHDPTAPVPGIGLQFWGPMEQARAWEQFVYDLKVRERAGVQAARITDKVRRASERFRLQLELDVDGHDAKTRDVSENGMAIRTETMLPVGMKVRVNVKARGEAFPVDVIVRRQIQEPGFRGLGVEFADLSASPRKAIVTFVREAAPREDVVFVKPGDPELH
jgi:hypothetical protein